MLVGNLGVSLLYGDLSVMEGIFLPWISGMLDRSALAVYQNVVLCVFLQILTKQMTHFNMSQTSDVRIISIYGDTI